MEYLNDYNDSAKIMKIKFVFEVYVKSFKHEILRRTDLLI